MNILNYLVSITDEEKARSLNNTISHLLDIEKGNNSFRIVKIPTEPTQ